VGEPVTLESGSPKPLFRGSNRPCFVDGAGQVSPFFKTYRPYPVRPPSCPTGALPRFLCPPSACSSSGNSLPAFWDLLRPQEETSHSHYAFLVEGPTRVRRVSLTSESKSPGRRLQGPSICPPFCTVSSFSVRLTARSRRSNSHFLRLANSTPAAARSRFNLPSSGVPFRLPSFSSPGGSRQDKRAL